METDSRKKAFEHKEAVAQAARAFVFSLGIADWFLILLMCVSVSNAPTMFEAFDKPADPVFPWRNYWTMLTFIFVYSSIIVFCLYLLNYTSKILAGFLGVLYVLNTVVSIACVIQTTMKNIGHLNVAYESDLLVNSVCSVLIAFFITVRMAKDKPKREKPSEPLEDVTKSKAEPIASDDDTTDESSES